MNNSTYYSNSNSFPNISVSYKANCMFEKNHDAFKAKEGICYIDSDKVEYSYWDIVSVLASEKWAESLYGMLNGLSPEKTMQKSLNYTKCPRCGRWNQNTGRILFGREENFICEACTPLRTNGFVSIDSDPYGDMRKFYTKKSVTFKPGLTTLLGCNGIGKTTLMSEIAEYLKGRGTPYLMLNDSGEDGWKNGISNALDLFMTGNHSEDNIDNLEYAGMLYSSSEGEKIKAAFIRFTKKISDTLKSIAGIGEFWLLLDSLDSGLSIDILQQIKNSLHSLYDKNHNFNVYIIVSSNSYEMCEDTMVFSVEKMKYVNLSSYNSFKKAVYSSTKHKEKRDYIFSVKKEIYKKPYEYNYNKKLSKELDSGRGSGEGILASMSLDNYKLEISVKAIKYKSCSYKTYLYKKIDGDRKRISVKIPFNINHFHLYDKEKCEREMHDYICNLLLIDAKKNNFADFKKIGD